MAELKTRPTTQSVAAFLATYDEQTRRDCETIAGLMQEATGAAPVMWGTSIVGFGSYHYRYASGQEADWPLVGFSPRKQNLTLYIMAGFEQYDDLLKKLGTFRLGKACLYIKRLSNVDLPTLNELIVRSVEHMRATNPAA